MRTPALLAAALLLATPALPQAAQAKILLQVRDPEEHPVRYVRLTYGGVRSLPTNTEGATELNLPANRPPGLPIKIFLESNPKKDWFLTNPTINVPAEGFPAELVVMSRTVFRRLAAEVREAGTLARSQVGPAGKDGPTLKELAVRYHLKPEQIEEAIRAFGDTKSFLDQGISAYLAGEYAQAEGLLRSASAKAERDFVEAQRYLAESLLAQKKVPEAVTELRRAVAVQPNNIDLLNELGLTLGYYPLRDWKEAVVVQRKVLALAEARFGPEADRTAWALGRLAHAVERTNDHDEAELLRRKILKIAEANHGPDHPEVASALGDLARLLQARGCFPEALAMSRRALSIQESHFRANDFEFQLALADMASLLDELGRPREALDQLRRSLPMTDWRIGADRRPFVPAKGPFFFPFVDILKANVLFELNRLEEAEVLWRSLVALCEEHKWSDFPITTEFMIHLAELLQATNRFGEAEDLIRRVLARDRRWTGPNGLGIARDLEHLGDVLIATNCLREAEAPLQEALELYRALSLEAKSLTPGTEEALERYSRLLEKLGQPEDAVQARLAELRQGLPPAAPEPLCTPPPD